MLPISHSTSMLPPLTAQPTQIRSFLKAAKKVAQLALATLLTIVATGLFAIGVTMTPFALETGLGVIALSTALFGTAAYLFQSVYSKSQSAN